MGLGTRALTRVIATGLVGGLVAAACLYLAFGRDAVVSIDLDRHLPRLSSGFYSVEQSDDASFVWTSHRAVLTLDDLDRRSAWRCSVRVRGARPAPLEQPAVVLAVDDIGRATYTATNEYADLEVVAPPRSGHGLTLGIISSPTFVPGASDRRELGVQVTRLECRAEGDVRPPVRALIAGGAAGGAFAAAFVLVGLGPLAALTGSAVVSAAQVVPITWGPAPYTSYPLHVLWTAIAIASVMGIGVPLVQRVTRRTLHPAARFVLAFSAGALFLELLALLHPSKAVVDALFHAHRLEWVLDGTFYFTQPMPNGVRFPYAIGLYVFAAPWSVLTRDHVLLLRIVVSAAHGIAGALLYWTIVRSWGDRLAGAIAVVLFHVVPLPFVVIGNANLTYAFGQSVAFITLAVAIVWPLGSPAQRLTLFALASLAFLSHVGVAPLLFAALALIGLPSVWGGDAALRAPGRVVLFTALLAAMFSVAVYYGHFAESYKTLARVRTQATAVQPADTDVAPAEQTSNGIVIHARAGRALQLATRAFGWPILALGAIGLWRLRDEPSGDRLKIALAALAAMYLGFVGVRVLMPVDVRFQRYADEFIDRVNYMAAFGVVILAARGAGWTWRIGAPGRLAAAALVLAAFVLGQRHWTEWLTP